MPVTQEIQFHFGSIRRRLLMSIPRDNEQGAPSAASLYRPKINKIRQEAEVRHRPRNSKVEEQLAFLKERVEAK